MEVEKDVLNQVETFWQGFKIVRNGEIITLTSSEMSEFKKMNDAQTASDSIEANKDWLFGDYSETQKEKIEELQKDAEWLENLQDSIMEAMFEDCQLEQQVIKEAVDFELTDTNMEKRG